MSHRSLAMIGFFLTLFVCPSLKIAHARFQQKEKVTNDSGMSRRQILRMGLKSFVGAYQNHLGFHRWQIEEHAYILYARCKSYENERRLADLPRRRRNRARAIYIALGLWESHAFQLRYDEYPHGSAVRSIAFRRPAEFEEYMGQLIALYASSPNSTGITISRQQQAETQMRQLLLFYQDMNRAPTEEREAEFRRDLKYLQADTIALKKILHTVPLEAGTKLIEHLKEFAADIE